MTVTIEQGTLEGFYSKTILSNKLYASFLGIPYAKPPIGDLRFKPPVKHPGWSGILKAFSEGNKCMQYDDLLTKTIIGSEDCLYLNIYVPQEESNEKKAVMVFIHGGAFIFGDASRDMYSPDHLLDENVIVVTMNYRLNVLGFLNLDINECPGNMGLKDQLFALKWVKANISAFGGDFDNITIFGESAGAASVHCHILSPQSKGLFQRAIMQSGSMLNLWAFQSEHKSPALKLAKQLGCKKEDPKEIVQYLLNVPANDLVNATITMNKFEDDNKNTKHYGFIPSIESEVVSHRFLPATPDILIKTASPIPIITGLNDMEGMIIFGEGRLTNVNDFHKLVISILLKYNYSEEAINKIQNFYFNEHNLRDEQIKLENICHFMSDVLFVKDFYPSFKHLLKQDDVPVYNYEFKFDGEINGIKKLFAAKKPKFQSLKGACHGDEMNYMFYSNLLRLTPETNSPEFRMCKIISKLWTNFAKTGNPNSPDLCFKWNSITEKNPKYLSIDRDNICMVDGFVCSSRLNFWENLKK